jgi:hypothetical protein
MLAPHGRIINHTATHPYSMAVIRALAINPNTRAARKSNINVPIP